MAKKKKTVDELLEEALVPKEEHPYEVPGNWVWVYTPNLFDIEYGKNLPISKLKEDGYPVFGANGQIGYYDEYTYEEPKILISCRGANSGSVNISLAKSYITNNSLILNQKLNMSIQFVKFLFECVDKSNLISGTAQPQITLRAFGRFPLLLPPLKEQQRIVDKIESLFSKIGNARELIEEAREELEDRKAAILARAFRGELTKKWREGNPDVESAEALLIKIEKERENVYLRECKVAKFKGLKKPIKQKRFEYNLHINDGNSLPKLWKYASLGDIVYSFKYGTSAKSDYLYNGMPVIRIPNINNLRINLSDMKYLKDDDIEESNKVTEGDILITRSNGSRDLVAKNAIVEEEFEGYAYASYLIRIRPLLVNSKYVLLLLNEKNTKEQFFSKAKSSAGINNINTQELATTIIPLPPLEEQKEIVRILDKLLSFESKIEELTQLEEQIELLKKSILSKAFRGELGTNDPTEESALGLLKEVIKDNGKSQE